MDVIVLGSNQYTATTAVNQVVVVPSLPAPEQLTVLNDLQTVTSGSGSTNYWSLQGNNLYPTSASYSAIIGGSSLVTDEMLRIVGKLNATSISLGTDAYSIYTSAGEMVFKDTLNTKKLSEFGGVSSITASSGMDFTTITGTGGIKMGVPSTITVSTTNTVSGTTHTHAVDSSIIVNNASYSNPSWITALAENKVLPNQSAANGKYLKSDGTSSSWATFTLTDDILDYDSVNAKYTPYSAQTTGAFDSSSTNPLHTTRLNYDGNFYATNLYGNHVVGGTTGDLAYTNGTYITTGIGNWGGTTLILGGNVQANVVYVNNQNTSLTIGGAGDLTFTDSVTGTKTLASLVSGATNYWNSNAGGIWYGIGNVAVGGTTYTSGSLFTVHGNIAATNFESAKYRWRNSNLCIGPNAGDNELNSNKVYLDNTSTSDPMLYGDLTLRYWKFNGDTYWAVGKKQYFSSTTNSIYADASNNLTFKDGVAASGTAIKLVSLINGTYNALKSDFTNYSGVTAISSGDLSNWNTAYTKSSILSITGAGTHFLGEDGIYRPVSATISVGDDILEWDTIGGYYRPYTTKGAGHFYNTDATMPSNTNQLKYDGYFYSTRIYVDDLLSDVINTNGSTKTAGYFYTGTTDPSSNDRLNYDGYLYTTRTMSARMDITPISATSGIFMSHPYDNITGVSVATSGSNVYGVAVSMTTGTTGYGLWINDATTAGGYGVWSSSTNGIGVYGASGVSVSGRFNNATGSTANIIEAQLNGVNKAYIDYTGNLKSLVLNTAGGTKTAGNFYTGTTAPTDTNRLNYSGYLYATQLYDDGNRVSTFTPAYGEIYGNSSFSQSVPFSSSATQWKPANLVLNSASSGITGSAANNQFTIDTSGKYLVRLYISVTTGASSSGQLSIYYDGAAINNANIIFPTSITDTDARIIETLIDATATKIIAVYETGSTTAGTSSFYRFVIQKVQ